MSIITRGIISRTLFSFLGNLVRAALSFITGILLARGLGPADFGVFGFLLASFTALTQLLDMGSSNAFQTFMSKRLRSKTYLLYYVGWLVIQFFVLLIFIAVLAPEPLVESLWEGEPRERVLIAFLAVFLQQKVWQTVIQIGESQRLTHLVQLVSVSIAAVHLIIISILVWQQSISVEIVYLIVAVEFALGIVVAILLFPLQFSPDKDSLGGICKEYGKYCYPLVPNAWVAVIAGFADAWMLQHYGGAVEQAYYTVAMQFSIISLVATRSVLNILWKEVAEAYGKRELEVVRKIFSRSTKMLHQLGAIIAGLLVPWTIEIIILALGEIYLAGAFSMMIMFLYPINQARGQVAGTMLLAMEMTAATFWIGIGSSLLGIVITYFLIAPPDAGIPGLGMASTGLALKMVGVQFITVNISLWWIAKKLKQEMEWTYQFTGLGICLLLGYGTYFIVNQLVGNSSAILLRMILGAFAYCVSTAILVYYSPSFLALSYDEVRTYWARMVATLKHRII